MRLPVLVLILCFLLLIITDWVIIRDLRVMSLYDKFQPSSKKRRIWWKIYGILALLTLALLIVAICLPRRNEESEITVVMWMLFTVMTVEIAQIVYTIFSLIGFIPVLFGQKRWNTGLWVGFPLAVLFFSMMWWGVIIGRYRINIEKIDITSEKLPSGFNNYKIAQISDLHLGTWGTDTTFVSRLVDSVNNQKPNLIVFTGDIVNRRSSEMKPFLKVLGRLKAPDGVVSVLGNHDYGDYISWSGNEAKKANLDSLRSYETQIGWELLENNHKSLVSSTGDTIILIGVGNWGEPPFSQYGDLKTAYPEKLHNDRKFKILLSHNPEHWNREVSKNTNIDLTLAGHTHAMQIELSVGNWKWSPSQYKYEQWGGLYSRKGKDGSNININVNIGAGEVGLPMRIGAPAEITLITLKK